MGKTCWDCWYHDAYRDTRHCMIRPKVIPPCDGGVCYLFKENNPVNTYEEGITPNIYQQECLRTDSKYEGYDESEKPGARLTNGLMGLNGEAGECIDILKKSVFQGHDLDREHLAEELGDVLWYVAISADALGYTLEQIMIMNSRKLRARYPEGFEVDRSVNRV